VWPNSGDDKRAFINFLRAKLTASSCITVQLGGTTANLQWITTTTEEQEGQAGVPGDGDETARFIRISALGFGTVREVQDALFIYNGAWAGVLTRPAAS